MKVALVGDVHAKLEDLADCEALHQLVVRLIEQDKPDLLVYLGDQYHTHAIVNVEVQRHWMRAFHEQKEAMRLNGKHTLIAAIVGNHDRPGNLLVEAHAMQVHERDILVVDHPHEIDGTVLLLPYYGSKEEMVAHANEDIFAGINTLLCHATFDGAKYENGFYAKEAVSADLFPQERIISGHIHAPSRFGKVWYPGSPRWQTVSDANVERAIYVVDLENNTTSSWATDGVLRKIWQLHETEGDETKVDALLECVKPGDRALVNLQGSQSYIEQRKKDLARPGLRFRALPTDQRGPRVRESEGVNVAWRKWVDGFKPKFGTPPEVVQRLVQERVRVG